MRSWTKCAPGTSAQRQSRPLDALYPIVYLDALQVKIKSEGRIQNKALYLAIGINVHGHKEVLGLWASQNEGAKFWNEGAKFWNEGAKFWNEGAKFWLGVVTELKNRGVQDIFIAGCPLGGLTA